jgi:hypothetical protein
MTCPYDESDTSIQTHTYGLPSSKATGAGNHKYSEVYIPYKIIILQSQSYLIQEQKYSHTAN